MATPDYTLKRFDTYPPLQSTLTDSNGPIDLTTAVSVKLILKGTTTIISGNCVIVNAPAGIVKYVWAAGDTNVADTYEAEWEIHWTTGVQTVPNAEASNPIVRIDPDLEDA